MFVKIELINDVLTVVQVVRRKKPYLFQLFYNHFITEDL